MCIQCRWPWVWTGYGHVPVLGRNRGGGRAIPQGLLKEGGTQLRPGPITGTSDPKGPLQPGGE